MTPAVSWAQARIHWIKGELSPLAETLIGSRDSILNENKGRTDAVRDMLIRALVRQKRLEDARRELAKFDQPPHALYAAMIEVSSRDPAAARKAVEQYLAENPAPAGLAVLYKDPDIGPAFDSPELFSLRIKYPEPTAPAGTQPSTKPAGG
jgi:hypothetical protein